MIRAKLFGKWGKVAWRERNLVQVKDLQVGHMFSVEREGVFVHSFVCQNCGLHFLVFSWQSNRHRVDNTYCPECGRQGAFLHWKHQLSASREFRFAEDGSEIYNYVPFRNTAPEADSVFRTPAGLVKLYDRKPSQ